MLAGEVVSIGAPRTARAAPGDTVLDALNRRFARRPVAGDSRNWLASRRSHTCVTKCATQSPPRGRERTHNFQISDLSRMALTEAGSGNQWKGYD
jgi:hypothetical protein